MKNTKRKVVLTGDRPTGALHLGHFLGSLKKRVELQEDHKQFVMIADVQALTDNFSNPDKVRKSILDVALDYLAVGIDPTKSTIFIQSLIPQLSELTMYYLNLVTVARLQRNPTVKEEIKQKEFGASIPAGFLCYPVSQAADITAFKADLVPVGEDQLPMLEQTREIVQTFNRTYKTEVLVKPTSLLSDVTRLSGIDGKAKMGKSLGNAIYLSEGPDELKKKVMSMYTDPNHIRVEDPGSLKGNTVFSYLDAFDSNTDEVTELKAHYQRGGLGDVTVKKRLLEILMAELDPIRKKREEFAKDPGEVMAMLKKGTAAAEKVAQQTLSEVKAAMRIDYF